MSRTFSTLSFLFLVFFISSCQKELKFTGTPDPVVNLPEPITTTVQGNIYDETGMPASGVNIAAGTKTTTTNSSGYFRITDASLDKTSALVTAEKNGYYTAYRVFSATAGVNQVVIKLIKKTLAGTVSAATGGDVTLANGTKINLKAGGVVTAAGGAAYTGNVNVYAAYIDPTASDIDEIIPGSFLANDKNNNRVTLSSYGMVAVELEADNGNKLQIKSGTSATLTLPIPASIQASAPATIALWSVDETTGVWKEEGSATKQGDKYVGDVSHFSFWNCDIGIPAIKLSLTIKNPNGVAITHAHVRIKRTTANGVSQTGGWTDSLGQVSGLVPANESLVLQIVDNCNNVIYTQNIGPFTANTNLGVITITPIANSMVIVTGKLISCSGAAVTNGFAIIKVDNIVRNVRADSLGNFSATFLQCSTSPSSYSILGVDAIALQQGNTLTGTLTSPTTNTGNVLACGNSAAQFLNYTLDGTNYSMVPPADTLNAFTRQVQGSTNWQTVVNSGLNTASTPGQLFFNFVHATKAPGSYPIGDLQVRNFKHGNTVIAPFNVNLTVFPQNIGEFYEGNFNGQFKDSFNVTHNLSSTFRIRRAF